MSWTRPSIQTIYNRVKADIQSNVTDGVPIPRVSMLGIIASVFSGGVHLCYGFLEWMKNQIFVDVASAWGRERWSNILGISRKASQYSTGYLSFTGTGSHVVPSGTLVVNNDGYEYETLADFTIGTDDEVAAQAVVAGEESNTDETTLTLSSPDPDIDSTVSVEEDPDTGATSFLNGSNLETVEAWVLRMLYRFQNPPACGNAADYVRWALGVPGVQYAWCRPAEDFVQGSVGVYIAVSENVSGHLRHAPASDALVASVETYIESIRPAPAYVVYSTIAEYKIRIYASITPYVPDMASAIEDALFNLFLIDSGPNKTVKISHIRSAIASTGVDDYTITDMSYLNEYGTWVSMPVGDIDSVYPNTPVLNMVYFDELI